MRRPISAFIMLITLLASAATVEAAASKEDVGTVVALRGKARIERGENRLEAKLKSGVLLKDAIATGEASRAKLLFIDDSVLTLAEKSRMAIKEFVHSKEDRGKAIFNLLEGKMRSVVGKTKFEVHTPTAVAAARGTVIFFETGVRNGRKFTTIVCLEGTVEVWGARQEKAGSVSLTQGMSVTVVEGEAPPAPAVAPAAVLDSVRKETASSGIEISLPKPELIDTRFDFVNVEIPFTAAPIQQQPAVKQPTAVNINIRF